MIMHLDGINLDPDEMPITSIDDIGESMDDVEKMIDKVKVNSERATLFDPYEVFQMLLEAGEDWRIIWEELPTLGLFDQLYSLPDKYNAFVYRDTFFERRPSDELGWHWEMFTEEGELFIDWILDHPPFECCVPIADLFRHAQNLEPDCSPWKLFEHITGYDIDYDVVMPVALLPIGGNDAVTLGRALEAWGEYADVVDPYIQLINHYNNA